MHNVVKWPNMLLKSSGVNTARFIKCVWPFYNIMHERVKAIYISTAAFLEKTDKENKSDNYRYETDFSMKEAL